MVTSPVRPGLVASTGQAGDDQQRTQSQWDLRVEGPSPDSVNMSTSPARTGWNYIAAGERPQLSQSASAPTAFTGYEPEFVEGRTFTWMLPSTSEASYTPQGGDPLSGTHQLSRVIKNHHLLNKSNLSLVERLWSIILSKSLQFGPRVRQGIIDVEEDPEERTNQVVLRVHLEASPAQTMAFWDSLDIELDRWLEHLKPQEQKSVINGIGLRFHWLQH
jgi:hypothetical protein